MLSLDALYAGTFAVASRATDHLGPLGGLADRLADRVLPQAVAKAGCQKPRLCRKWIYCERVYSDCFHRFWSCARYCEGETSQVCEWSCLCTSTRCG